MWLPKPIYEGLPYIYIAFGILFLLGSTYLGFSHPSSIAYGGLGVVCILTGVFIRDRRHEARSQQAAAAANSTQNEAANSD